MTTLTELLHNPEDYFPRNFDTPERANPMLTGLCQDAATEIERLNKAVEAEREACAKVCESQPMRQDIDVREQCAAAVRARGNT